MRELLDILLIHRLVLTQLPGLGNVSIGDSLFEPALQDLMLSPQGLQLGGLRLELALAVCQLLPNGLDVLLLKRNLGLESALLLLVVGLHVPNLLSGTLDVFF